MLFDLTTLSTTLVKCCASLYSKIVEGKSIFDDEKRVHKIMILITLHSSKEPGKSDVVSYTELIGRKILTESEVLRILHIQLCTGGIIDHRVSAASKIIRCFVL